MTILLDSPIFSVNFRARMTPAILAAINSSPIMLALIAQARSHVSEIEFQVGTSGKGWFFDDSTTPRRIVVDPDDFTNYATNPGGFVLRAKGKRGRVRLNFQQQRSGLAARSHMD